MYHVRVSGCVIILGKTNMFRYNDPKEAASMRMNASINGGLHPQSAAGGVRGGAKLLSQSLSDLRLVATSAVVSSHEQLAVFSDSEEAETIFNTPGGVVVADAKNNNNSVVGHSSNAKSKSSVMSESSAKCSSVSDTSERSEEVVTPESSTSGATASSSGTGADSSLSSIQDMTRLFDQINQQVSRKHHIFIY